MKLPKIPDTLGRFTRGALLGQGGMGAVFRAHDPQLGRDVALKVLLTEEATLRDDRARFIREIKSMAAIQDPGVVRIFDSGVDQGWYYFTMELLEGQSLAGLITLQGRQSISFVVTLGLRLASAIEAIHKLGMIHRDVKPQNVFIGNDGRVTLMDLGLVKASGTTLQTAQGHLLGTPRYIPPEIIVGSPITPVSDIYQLGIVLYEAATGRCPFEPGPFSEVLRQVLQGVQQTPRALCPDIPEPLERLILAAIGLDPARRPASALDFENSLKAIEKGLRPAPSAAAHARRPVPRPPPRPVQEIPRSAAPLPVPPGRGALRRAGMGAGLVALTALLAIFAHERSVNGRTSVPVAVPSAGSRAGAGSSPRPGSPFDRPGLSQVERTAINDRLDRIANILMKQHAAVGTDYVQLTLIADADGMIEASRRLRDQCTARVGDLETLRRDMRTRIPAPDQASPADAVLWIGQAAWTVAAMSLAEQAAILLKLSRAAKAGSGDALSVWQRARTETRYSARVATELGTFVDCDLALLSAAAAEPGRAGWEATAALDWLHFVAENLQDGLDHSEPLLPVVRGMRTRLAQLAGPAGAPLGRLGLALWEQTDTGQGARTTSARDAILLDIQTLQALMPAAVAPLEKFKRLIRTKSSRSP